MAIQVFTIIVASPRGLVRDSLAALLRARTGSQVATSDSLEHALTGSPEPKVLVCDASGMAVAEFDAFVDRAHRTRPGLRVIRIDDSSGAAGLDAAVAAVRAATTAGSLPHDSLTPLEAEVVLAVAAGLRNADIARRMRRSGKTVEKHRANALRKLGIRSVAQLTAYAIRHRLLDDDAILAPRPD
jgi:DNA-binding CsgD family transcriptional regulator